MQSNMFRRVACGALLALTAALVACGGGGYNSMTSSPQSGTVPVVISDASAEDWAAIDVKLLRIALIPQGGGSAVTVWTAPAQVPSINLAQLDQLGEIPGNPPIPVGTYTGATLTVGANPGDVSLTVAADPETGFPVAPGTVIPGTEIQILGAEGGGGALTVPVKVSFDSPLMVSTGQNNAVDIEFDLRHPAFIIGHTPPAAAGATIWAVNFKGAVRHRPVRDITRLVLRHTYGTVQSVDASNAFITITKDYPVRPVTNPETAIASDDSLRIYADATNGTIFYDVDAKTTTVIKDFSAEASTLDGKYVRLAARYQVDGRLTAVRLWASTQFNNVWVSPEGHVLHVDTAANLITVANESGRGVPVAVDANTQFFFRVPQDALADATPIGTGPAFLASHDLVRGFKVHVSATDPLATPLLAQTIDIETAVYDGRISGANTTSFTYTRRFATVTDDYSVTLPYIAATSANTDPGGNSVMGFLWWNFTFPTAADTGAGAVADFVAATNGGVNFGGTVGTLSAFGVSGATWGDPANSSGWSLRNAVLLPTPVPLGLVSTAFAGNSFAMTVFGGTLPVTVDVSRTPQSATLVYQVDRTNGVITVSPIDVTTASGLAAITAGLTAGAPVKVFGVPQSDGTLKAYALAYFTGTMPAL